MNWRLVSPLNRQDLAFAVNRWMIKAKVEAPPSERISDSSLLVRGQDDERYRSRRNGSDLRNAQLPYAEDLKEQSFEFLVHLIDFIDEQDAGLLFLEEGAKQWSFGKEAQTVQFLPDRFPVTGLNHIRFKEQPLQRFVELANRLLFVDANVTLQPFNMRVCRFRNRIGEFCFPASWGTFNENWPPHLCGEIDDPKDRLVGQVLGVP